MDTSANTARDKDRYGVYLCDMMDNYNAMFTRSESSISVVTKNVDDLTIWAMICWSRGPTTFCIISTLYNSVVYCSLNNQIGSVVISRYCKDIITYYQVGSCRASLIFKVIYRLVSIIRCWAKERGPNLTNNYHNDIRLSLTANGTEHVSLMKWDKR